MTVSITSLLSVLIAHSWYLFCFKSEAGSKLSKKSKRTGRQNRVPSTPVSNDDVSVTEATKTAKTGNAEDTAYEDNSQDDTQDDSQDGSQDHSQDDTQDNSQDGTEAPRIDVKKCEYYSTDNLDIGLYHKSLEKCRIK